MIKKKIKINVKTKTSLQCGCKTLNKRLKIQRTNALIVKKQSNYRQLCTEDVLQLDYGHHQCAPDDNRSRFIHQPLIVRINFEGGHLKTKFERDKHCEFSVHQFPSIQAKNAFDAFNQRFQSLAFTVVHFRRQ